MPRSPQEVYARLLSSPRGYPLWTPEPSNELLAVREDGLRIGDVGVVIPGYGGFDVFFNITLPSDHPFHRRFGVPEGFTCIEDELEIRTDLQAESPGRYISSSSVTQLQTAKSSDSASQRDASTALAYNFTLSADEGALLILPEGANRCELLNDGLFVEQACKHGAEWYNYAVNRRHRIISHDALYLITGFYKAHSWSVAAFDNVVGNEGYTAQFKRVGGTSSAPTFSWDTTCALDWRVGPPVNHGVANQSVFIRGLKIALRTGFLGAQRISVEADFPSTNSTRSSGIAFGTSRYFGNLARQLGRADGNTISRTTAQTGPIKVPQRGVSDLDGHDGTCIEIQRVPNVPPAFHPADAINRYLLHEEPSANIAIANDSHWISMLEEGFLTLKDFEQDHWLEKMLSQNYSIVSEGGVVRLERKCDLDTIKVDVPHTAVDTDSEKDPEQIPGSGVCGIGFTSQTSIHAHARIPLRESLLPHTAILEADIRTVKLIVISDYVCSLCYIANKNLYDAIEACSDLPIRFDVEFRPFALWSPQTIDEYKGTSLKARLMKRLGEEQAEVKSKFVTDMAQKVGLRMAEDGVVCQSTQTHRLSVKAYKVGGQEMQRHLNSLIFDAYFANGEDISSEAFLANVAVKVGLMNREKAIEFLRSTETLDRVEEMIQAARANCINSVPCIIIDGKWTLNGVQSTDCYIQIFRMLARSHSSPAISNIAKACKDCEDLTITPTLSVQ